MLSTQESRIFNVIDTDWGDGTSWSNFVAMPRDIHWYYFKTEATFDTWPKESLREWHIRHGLLS